MRSPTPTRRTPRRRAGSRAGGAPRGFRAGEARPRQAIVGPIDGVDLQDHLEPERIGQLVELYGAAWWASERDAGGVEQMLAGTDLVLALIDRAADRLVGFARVLTDWRYRAYVYDVIVAEDWRDRGLGRALMDAVVAHPRLAAVELIELSCQPEMVPFYRRWGFSDDVGGSLIMRRR
jgi:GNAT superfamily N-acetyltransferase